VKQVAHLLPRLLQPLSLCIAAASAPPSHVLRALVPVRNKQQQLCCSQRQQVRCRVSAGRRGCSRSANALACFRAFVNFTAEEAAKT
jgi:hypothetical protein